MSCEWSYLNVTRLIIVRTIIAILIDYTTMTLIGPTGTFIGYYFGFCIVNSDNIIVDLILNETIFIYKVSF